MLSFILFADNSYAQVYAPPPPPNTPGYCYSGASGAGYGRYNGYRYYYQNNYRYENQHYNHYYPTLGTLLGSAVIGLVTYAIYDNAINQRAVWQSGNTTYQTETTPLLGWKYAWDGTQWIYIQTVVGYTWWNGNNWVSYYYPQN